MVVIRKRLLFWLFKAYIKKSSKTIIISFVLGLSIFFLLLFASKNFTKFVPLTKKVEIGVVGAYTRDNLPPIVLNNLSRGLTKVENDGTINPDLAESWESRDDGKTYIFHLRHNLTFNNGKEVTSDKIIYNFKDVTIERPDKYTLVFKLKDPYSPFLVTAAKPVFQKGFIGVGDYRIEDVQLNGDFVQSLTLASVKNRLDTVHFQFYPSEQALKTAFLLGEISEITGLTSKDLKETSFEQFPRVKVDKNKNYTRLVTLFFNTTEGAVSDKKLRLALLYAMPVEYPQGEKAFLPYSPESFFYNNNLTEKAQDFSHSVDLLSNLNSASDSAKKSDEPLPKLTLKTLKKYRLAADKIAVNWNEIGLETKVEEVEEIPGNFQIFLGDFNLPKDPDQYTLWHSDQKNNITNYKNLRIDKLLEDGRKIYDINERKKIYDDFQKYLIEDAPAIFLYFPYEYSIRRG